MFLSCLAYQVLSRLTGTLLLTAPRPASRGLASLLGLLDPGSLERLRHNARSLTRGANTHTLAKRMQQARARAILEMLAAEARDGAWLARRTRVRGLPAIEEALRAGRGAVMAWNHLGAWDVGARVLNSAGLRITAHA